MSARNSHRTRQGGASAHLTVRMESLDAMTVIQCKRPAPAGLMHALSLSLAFAFAGGQPSMAGSLTLITGLNAPNSLAINASGRSVLFSQLAQSPCNGEVDSLPADGGPLTQIATNTALNDSGGCRGVGPLWFSTKYTLYGYGGYDVTNIDREKTPCGNNCTHLVTGLGGGRFFGTLNGNAYFMSNFNSLNVQPVSGGSSAIIANGYFIRATSLDAYPPALSGLYFVDYNTSSVFTYNLMSNSVDVVIEGLPDEGSIITDSKNVYWTDGNSIVLGVKGQLCSTPSCSVLFSGSVKSMIVDESETDNTTGNIFFSDGAQLWSLSKGGGPPKLMYSGVDTEVLQTDGSQVYFLDNGTLRLLPVHASTATTPLSLSAIATSPISTLNDGFYWLDGGNGSPGAGSLSYVAEQASQVDSFQYSTSLSGVSEHACSCKAAVLAALARYILRADGQYIAASGIKIDNFFIATSATPCAKGDPSPGANWNGNGTWTNPVAGKAKFGNKTHITGDVIGSMLANGPVLIQDTIRDHWIMATNVATVKYDGGQATGIIAYDPLSGSKLLLDFNLNSGSYYVYLILDPLENVWCSGPSECPALLNDINMAALQYSQPYHGRGNPNFSSYDLTNVLVPFMPNYVVGTTVSP